MRMQAAALRQAALSSMDAQQATDMQSKFVRDANMQAHDHGVARWLDSVPDHT